MPVHVFLYYPSLLRTSHWPWYTSIIAYSHTCVRYNTSHIWDASMRAKVVESRSALPVTVVGLSLKERKQIYVRRGWHKVMRSTRMKKKAPKIYHCDPRKEFYNSGAIREKKRIWLIRRRRRKKKKKQLSCTYKPV